MFFSNRLLLPAKDIFRWSQGILPKCRKGTLLQPSKYFRDDICERGEVSLVNSPHPACCLSIGESLSERYFVKTLCMDITV
ncbi:MAG: hypothetical protein D3906_05960 [Candidatus Electrothrix sp. AUS1_2]|nr:hypothetical protein [Candidatus Electrothrix sp. AUS1_2]